MSFWGYFLIGVVVLAIVYAAAAWWSYRNQKRLVAGGDPLSPGADIHRDRRTNESIIESRSNQARNSGKF